jgi:hypothetical protein
MTKDQCPAANGSAERFNRERTTMDANVRGVDQRSSPTRRMRI